MMSTPPILAALLTPGLFAAGAGAMSVPIVIHLLARRRFRIVRWAAMDFLLEADRQNRRRVRMEEWILLALRCLAALLIGLALARPFFRPAGLGAIGGSQRTERVFLIDDSFSMGYAAQGGMPFAKAKKAVRRLIGSIRQESPDDTVTLIRTSAPLDPLATGNFLNESQSKDLLERLEALTPSQKSMDLRRVAKEVVTLLTRDPDVTNAVVYLVSDFQSVDWTTDRSAGVGESGEVNPFAPLRDWAKDGRSVYAVLVDVHEDGAGNTAVTDLALESGQLVAGTTGTIKVSVINLTNAPLTDVVLDVNVGNLAQPNHTINEVAPAQTARATIDVDVIRSGYDSMRVAMPPDRLPLDNVRNLAVDVVPAVRMLIVDGETSADSYDDEVTFLATALRPEGQVFSGNEVVVVDEAGLEDADLSSFHLIILANVYRISEPLVESLQRYVRNGGGLLIFLGDQVDADEYNAALFRSGDGLLPARLTQVIRSPGAAHLVISDRLHPTMRGLAGDSDPLGIGQIPFFEYFGSEPVKAKGASGAAVPGAIVDVNGADAKADQEPGASRPSRVIAHFDDEAERPAIVERPFGEGRVVMVTSSADKEWNLWPNHPTYLPMMMELARYVARRTSAATSYVAGDKIELSIDPSRYNPDVVVRTPAYPNEQEAGVTAAPVEGRDGLVLEWDHTDEVGVYQFVLTSRDGGEVVRTVAVNPDVFESDLTPMAEDDLHRALGDLPVEYIRGIDQLTGATGEARAEFWRPCIVALMLVLMGEQFLAWTWGRRR